MNGIHHKGVDMQVFSDENKHRLEQKVKNHRAYTPITKIQHVMLKEKRVYYQIVVWHEDV